MLSATSLVIGTITTVLFGAWILRRLRGSSEKRESWERHTDAQQRAPPVELGERQTVVVDDFSEHHSGERHAVGKVEGFVVFVEDIPTDLREGEVIDVEIRSFNRGHTSASGVFLEYA